jgi:ADP-heptose:LPS heptosyltransferase
MRTLVVHVGGIGDFLLACPAIRRLAEDGPVEILGHRVRAGLAVAAGFAQAAHDLDAVDFDSALTAPTLRLRSLLERFDSAVVWMKDAGEIERTFGRCGINDVRVCPGLPPEDWTAHASDYYLSSLGFQCAAPDTGPLLKDAFSEPANDGSAPSYDVVIHPGSGGKRKNWPLDRFLALATMLTNQGRSVTWSLGPAEEDTQLPAQSRTTKPCSLRELARRLASACLYIGNDSGITHLAAAVGCPTLAIFGPTNPRIWAPLGPHVQIIQGSPWPEVDAVLSSCSAMR